MRVLGFWEKDFISELKVRALALLNAISGTVMLFQALIKKTCLENFHFPHLVRLIGARVTVDKY